MKINDEMLKEILESNLRRQPMTLDEMIIKAQKYGESEVLEYLYNFQGNRKVEANIDGGDEVGSLVLPKQIKTVIKNINLISSNRKILFFGKPGTGKTETANLISKMNSIPFREINSFEVIAPNLGESLLNLRSLIFKDKEISELIIINEIDGLINSRDKVNESSEIHRLTSGLLNIFDSLPKNKSLIFTTNFLDRIDEALIRRFDYVINFDCYHKEDFKQIFKNQIALSDEMIGAISNDTYISQNTILKKYFNFLISLDQLTPSLITSSFKKIREQFSVIDKIEELDLFILFERVFVNEDLLSIIKKLLENNFSINEVYRIGKIRFHITTTLIKEVNNA